MKKTPGIRNHSKTRVFVAGMIGAGTTWATLQFGLNRSLDVQACTGLALKVGIVGGIWKIATTSVKSLRFLDWVGQLRAPKIVLGERPKNVEEIEGHYVSLLIGALQQRLVKLDPFDYSRYLARMPFLDKLLINPSKATIQAAAKDNILFVAAAIIRYLGKMDPPILNTFRTDLREMDPEELDVNAIKNAIAKLDLVNKELLKKLIGSLASIAKAKSYKWSPRSLAEWIAVPLFLREGQMSGVISANECPKWEASVTSMIENYSEIFE